ncbi:MAG: anthranilate phosphoribosyltransferase [Opitutales bacterium]|nr:anthranilate phosphoribosyltransferase [Opitutales bacterium]
MYSLKKFTVSLIEKTDLDPEQIKFCIDQLVSEKVDFAEKENFLISLSEKGETAGEISSFIEHFRILAKDPGLKEFSENAIDLCGTGGDKAGSFNISTFVSFIIASSGIPVIKHGNRSISSKCGSADLLEAIGIPLDIDKHKRIEGMKKLNYSFLFAPSFHPAFKHVAPVRKKLAKKGIISIFNILGPMINPAQPGYQLLGVYSKNLVSKVSKSLHQSGIRGGYVIHGCIEGHSSITGVDELTSCGKNLAQGIGKNLSKIETNFNPENFGFSQSPIEHLSGGDLNQNLNLMNQLLSGTAPSGLTSSILMNASLAFFTTGRTQDINEGVELARKLLRDGIVKKWLNQITTFFA